MGDGGKPSISVRRMLRFATIAAAAIGAAALLAWTTGASRRPRGGFLLPPSAPVSQPPRAGTLTVKVLVLNFDPLIAAIDNRPLHQALGWHDPRALADEYVSDVTSASAGFVRYRIAEWRNVAAFPRKIDGFLYTAADYLKNHRLGNGWHDPDGLDYRATLRGHGVPLMIDERQIDEVWFFGGPYFGYSEAAMAGPRAFAVNGEVIDHVPVSRPFVIMGFNYERGVAEMLENLCHRVEDTMSRVYAGWQVDDVSHDWARFAANQAQSGRAAVGTCHWPPNATHEYDFDNPRRVAATADDWLSYPRLTGRPGVVSRESWGGPDYARNFFRWWFAHLPRADGVSRDGRLHNWWKYVFDFNGYDERGRPWP